MANSWSKVVLVVFLMVCGSLSAKLALCAAADGATTQSRVEVVLDLPYGSGSGSVGKVELGDPRLGSGPPVVPRMFQMTTDGTLWVLDTVNSRVLAFKDSIQVVEVSTLGFQKWPSVFGVTRDAIWVANTVNVKGKGPVFSLYHYDQSGSTWETRNLEVQNGAQFYPLKIRPFGTDDTLLIDGSLYGGGTSSEPQGATYASIVLNGEGTIVQFLLGEWPIPGMEGSVWRFEVLDDMMPSEIPFSLTKYNAVSKEWNTPVTGRLPRQPELSVPLKEASVHPIGLDKQGRLVVVVSEGILYPQRFIQALPTGEVVKALTLEDLGFRSRTLSEYPYTVKYQLLPDGSILAQYASADRYRIIRIFF